ncbi:MAG TPA: CheR family methyltransferase [Solirubrobacteraceae bacterium]|nr:CheR family methyltransferase [Solirubrobacteraceae bacterium]
MAELERRTVGDPDFFARVLDSLTVRVSDMFRDPSFFQAFRRRVVPLLRTFQRVNIWHAGCAGGEEVYSLAILLSEERLYDRCQIYATDLNPRAIEKAKRGVYEAGGGVALSASHRAAGGQSDLARYATDAHGGVSIHASLRRNILFFQHDLVGDHVFGEMDVIFCRNVMIYFGRELQQSVLGKLGESLRPGGFLCLGRSERLSRAGQVRFCEFAPEERIYKKGSAA